MLLEKNVAHALKTTSHPRSEHSFDAWNRGDSILTDEHWNRTRDRFLAAVTPRMRVTVARFLADPHNGGQGLRLWLSSIAAGRSSLPAEVPADLNEVYLSNSTASPLHACQSCGLAVPVS